MVEYIDREEYCEKHCRCSNEHCDRVSCPIWKAPAADVAPVVHGRWEPCFDENCRCRWGFGKCSNCGQEYYAHAIDHYKYCPICGAKMDGAT